MDPETAALVKLGADIGGMGLFSVLVYLELRSMRAALAHAVDAVVTLAPRVRLVEIEAPQDRREGDKP